MDGRAWSTVAFFLLQPVTTAILLILVRERGGRRAAYAVVLALGLACVAVFLVQAALSLVPVVIVLTLLQLPLILLPNAFIRWTGGPMPIPAVVAMNQSIYGQLRTALDADDGASLALSTAHWISDLEAMRTSDTSEAIDAAKRVLAEWPDSRIAFDPELDDLIRTADQADRRLWDRLDSHTNIDLVAAVLKYPVSRGSTGR